MADFELKPCPFCGGDAAFFVRTSRLRDIGSIWEVTIACKKCSVTLPGRYLVNVTKGSNGQLIFHSDQEAAAADWNRRCDDA